MEITAPLGGAALHPEPRGMDCEILAGKEDLGAQGQHCVRVPHQGAQAREQMERRGCRYREASAGVL